jgi:integrase
MTLDDLDWERSEILVRGKGQRLERLPLPKDVGTALVHYLRQVRPACSTRKVFIRLKAPRRGLRLTSICCVVRRPQARRIEPRFQTGAFVKAFSGHQDVEPRCVPQRDRSTASSPATHDDQ